MFSYQIPPTQKTADDVQRDLLEQLLWLRRRCEREERSDQFLEAIARRGYPTWRGRWRGRLP